MYMTPYLCGGLHYNIYVYIYKYVCVCVGVFYVGQNVHLKLLTKVKYHNKSLSVSGPSAFTSDS